MNNSIIPANGGGALRPRQRTDRKNRELAQQTVNQVRQAALQADAAVALAGHLMQEVQGLDLQRRILAKEDVVMNGVLAEIEAAAIAQCKEIQRSLFNPWGL